MALEQRGNGQYYYRKLWRNGTCVSEYAGSGLLGQYASVLDDQERTEQAMQRLELRRFIQEQSGIDQVVDEHGKQVRQVVAVALQQLGYHQHKRQWRKARQMTSKKAMVPEYTDEEMSTYRALSKAAEGKKADSTAIKNLQEYASKHPGLFNGFWLLTSSSMANVLDVGGIEERHKIHFREEAIALKRSLGSKTASPLEVLLIDDIALCWLRLQLLEHHYSSAFNAGNVTFARAEYLEKRLSATRRRYHQAIESLARVRALLARAGVQINVAQQQVVMNG